MYCSQIGMVLRTALMETSDRIREAARAALKSVASAVAENASVETLEKFIQPFTSQKSVFVVSTLSLLAFSVNSLQTPDIAILRDQGLILCGLASSSVECSTAVFDQYLKAAFGQFELV